MSTETSAAAIGGWFAGRVPADWFSAAPEVSLEGDQIVVLGTLDEARLGEGASPETRSGAEAGRIARFREETRRYRIHVAREAEAAFARNVTWAARSGGTTVRFNAGGGGRHRREGSAEGSTVQVADRQTF